MVLISKFTVCPSKKSNSKLADSKNGSKATTFIPAPKATLAVA